MTDAEVKREVLVAFEYAYLHEDWLNPLSEALEGLTAEGAAYHPGVNGKSIWEIVLHLTVWNENIIERITTRQNTHPVEGAWPSPAAPATEEAWAAAQQRLWSSLSALKEFMETHSLDQLHAGPWGLGDLLCRFTHLGYHIGQITKIRELCEVRG